MPYVNKPNLTKYIFFVNFYFIIESLFLVINLLFKYAMHITIDLLNLDSLKASAVFMTSTYACSSNLLSVLFWLCLKTANLNAVCTSSEPCSKIAPNKKKNKILFNDCDWVRKRKYFASATKTLINVLQDTR